MIRKFLTILFAITLFVSCKNENEFTIKGEYTAAPDGTVVYMTAVDDILNVLDSAVVKDGTFEFTGEVNEMEIRYISTGGIVDGGYIAVEPGEMKFRFGGKVECSGTENNDLLNSFVNKCDEFAQLQMFTSPAYTAAMGMSDGEKDSIARFVAKEKEKFDDYAIKSINGNLSSPLGSFFFSKSVGLASAAKLEPLAGKIPEKYRDKFYERKLKLLKEIIETENADREYKNRLSENAKTTSAGKEMQNFEIKDITGKKVLFSDIVFSSKYTVLIFWASWDKGSIETAKEVDRLFAEYHKKGLNAAGLSLASPSEDVANIVAQEKFGWQQLCDPAEDCAEVATAYGVSSLPTIILIDKKGTIVARDLTVEELEKRVKELF